MALSSSSVCSGVSRSQEVIEFPLLKISISTPAGNPSEMKWTADVCRGGRNSVSETGAIIKTRTSQVAGCFRRGSNQIIKSKTMMQEKRIENVVTQIQTCFIFARISLQILVGLIVKKTSQYG